MSIAELEARVRRLERGNRWLKLIGGLAAIMLASLLLLGAATPKSTDYSTSDFRFRSLKTTELVLVDDNGERRARFFLLRGEPYFDLSHDGDDGFIRMGNAEGGPSIGLFGKHGKGVLLLTVADNKPSITFMDERANVVWRAP